MTTTELRELDAWIAENVMGLTQDYAILKYGHYYRPEARGYTRDINEAWRCNKQIADDESKAEGCKAVPIPFKSYTTDPAAAMDVLKKCIEKDAYTTGSMIRGASEGFGKLELQICLFAKQLFVERVKGSKV